MTHRGTRNSRRGGTSLATNARRIDERLAVRDSPIEGRGLFFNSEIAAGVIVVRLGGRLVSLGELTALIQLAETDRNAPYVDSITVYPDEHLVLPTESPIHFGNHSCNPTLWAVGPFEIATRNDVTAGQEATLDYGTMSGADGFRMECRCGVSACRGEVTSTDWMREELQERYRGHWVPALQQRIAAI